MPPQRALASARARHRARRWLPALCLWAGACAWARRVSSATTVAASLSKSKEASSALEAFQRELVGQAPPLAHIDDVEVETVPVQGESSFAIVASYGRAGAAHAGVARSLPLCRLPARTV